jgi:hypothetical protein
MSGSTMLMSLSNTGQMSGSTPVLAASTASFVANAQTASFVVTAQTASFVTTAQTASFVALAQSASNAVSAVTASFANAFTVAGNLTAQTLVVQTITSSVDFVTGSTRFGSILGNTHVFSGSVTMNPGGLFVSSSGLVGIGTTTPRAILDVSAGEGTPVVRLIRTTFAGFGSQLHFSTTGSNRFAIGLNPNDDLYFDRDTTGNGGWNPTTLVIQRLTGNIGIGTATITEGTQATSTISIFPNSSVSNGPLIQFSSNGRIRPAGITERLSIDGNALFLNSTFNANIIMVTGGGSVGIGTTSPNNLLSVRGNLDLGATGFSNPILSQYGSITFPRGQIMFSNTNSQNQLYIVGNAYSNSSGVFAYRNSAQPALGLGLDNGGMAFLTAGNGTADATISWNTQMVIDNTGVYYANTMTPVNLKPENTAATAITSLSSASSTYNQKPGVYWLNYGGQVFLGYVRFNWHQGRNWVLALKCHSTHDMPAGSALWQNNTLINQSDFNLQSGKMAKYGAWNNFPFTRLLYEMGNRIPPIMQWNSQKTSLYSVFSSISVGNGSGVGPDSTDPQLSTNSSTTYSSMTNFLGPNFTDFGGAEQIINYYGLGSFANVSSNSTSAANTGISSGFGLTTEHLGTFSGLQSTGRAGAWIGAPMDEAAAFFNRTSSAGADSGFGLGVAGGNNPRTATSGIISWALGNNVANFLPAYVWLSID